MKRTIGTLAMGVRTPIVKKGDDIVSIVIESVSKALRQNRLNFKDGDVIGITESLIARGQGNFASIDSIRKDIDNKFPNDIGIVFPILSRNRFSIILKAIASTKKNVHLLLNYPSDEVGNHLMDIDKMIGLGINPYSNFLTEEEYRDLFGHNVVHPFTGIDYVKLYKDLAYNYNISIYLSNDPTSILDYTKDILVANIHERYRIQRLLLKEGANRVLTLENILSRPVDGSGYNPEYGLYGSNLASEDSLKLFPRDSQYYVDEIQSKLLVLTGKRIEVMVYGDGAFKDPIGKIWELADPVVSPGYTKGLEGQPNEIKLKYLADNQLSDLTGDDVEEAIKNKIFNKTLSSIAESDNLGTTPRRITDLIGSLCDLVSGSGDKGTPVVYIQGYFDNYAND